MKMIFSLLIIFICISVFSQKTVTLYPTQDALIFYLSNQNGRFGATNTTNYGNSIEFSAMEWTWDGDIGSKNSLLSFNLSPILQNNKIISAYLSLYSDPKFIDKHSSLTGSNECLLQRVTSQWNEHTVTWNTQPNITTKNQVIIPTSTDENQNYEHIDVTDLVQDMINFPDESFGFFFSVKKQEHYRRMMFTTKENPNQDLHPKLIITYSSGNGNSTKKQSKDPYVKENNQKGILNLVIIDQNMNIIIKKTDIDIFELNSITDELSSGTYLFQIIDENYEINSFKVVK